MFTKQKLARMAVLTLLAAPLYAGAALADKASDCKDAGGQWVVNGDRGFCYQNLLSGRKAEIPIECLGLDPNEPVSKDCAPTAAALLKKKIKKN